MNEGGLLLKMTEVQCCADDGSGSPALSLQPVYRRHEFDIGISAKHVNLAMDEKRKGTSARNIRPKVSMPKPGGDCSVIVMKLGNASGAKGAGYPLCDPWANWKKEELLGLRETPASVDAKAV